jgi:hypothetical protein
MCDSVKIETNCDILATFGNGNEKREKKGEKFASYVAVFPYLCIPFHAVIQAATVTTLTTE